MTSFTITSQDAFPFLDITSFYCTLKRNHNWNKEKLFSVKMKVLNSEQENVEYLNFSKTPTVFFSLENYESDKGVILHIHQNKLCVIQK